VHVNGYYRKDGTYVQPYVRSSPDGNPYNNYSYPGNTNPYTGKVATGKAETYLQNYYNKSLSKDTKCYLNDYSIINRGNYLKIWDVEDTYVVYNIYDTYDKYNGYLAIYSDKRMRLFDRERNFVKQIDNFDQPLLYSSNTNSIYTNQSVSNPNSTNITPPYKTLVETYSKPETYYKSGRYLPKALSERKLKLYSTIYIKDKNGNYTDSYLSVTLVNETVTKYIIYNHNDIQIGSLSEYVNGEIFIYNAKDILVKHIQP
jgi:hypothetical protein